MPPKKNGADQVLEYVARRAKVRFCADGNFPARAVGILREMGAKVVTVREVGTRRQALPAGDVDVVARRPRSFAAIDQARHAFIKALGRAEP